MVALAPLAATIDLPAQVAPDGRPLTTTSLPAEAPSFADALTAVVQAEYGPHLSRSELDRIRKDFADSAAAYRRLREFPLVNSDEPDLSFSVAVVR
jgi:hypothetical protein